MNPTNAYSVGYCTPPKHTQFRKGQSGNPSGRPKGSQNISTILQKAARQRVKVTTNGRTRLVSKSEAAATQLANQAASGDQRATRDLFALLRLCEETAQTAPVQADLQEVDKLVMKSIVARIRQSEEFSPDEKIDPERKQSSADRAQ